MAGEFEIDVLQVRTHLIVKASSNVRSDTDRVELAEEAMQIAGEQLSERRLKEAMQLAETPYSIGWRARQRPVWVGARDQIRKIKKVEDVWQLAQRAKARLAEDPASPMASTFVFV